MGSLYTSIVHVFTDSGNDGMLEVTVASILDGNAGVLEVTVASTLDCRIFGGSTVDYRIFGGSAVCWV